MPVARSDPRRATLLAIAALVFAAAMVLAVLAFGGSDSGDVAKNIARSEMGLGSAESRAKAIARDGYPIGFNDPARFDRPIWLNHLGEDPATGWLAFDAAIGDCVVQWMPESRDFEDCEGRRYPATGEGLQQYFVTVNDNGVLVLNLNPDAISTTTTAPTTSTIKITG